MSIITIKSSVFLGLLVLIFIASASIGYALTINSSGFEFTAGNTYPNPEKYWFDKNEIYEHDFATVTGDNEVGIFSFSDGDIQEIIDGNYYAVSVGLVFSMFDGDTGIYPDGSDDVDYGDLVLSLGNSTNALTFDQFYLNGFSKDDMATVGYNFEIGDDYLTALSLAGLVQDSNGAIIFYINDTDEGGNKLYFDKEWAQNYSLSITFDTIPVPEPGTIFLMSSGIFCLILFREKLITVTFKNCYPVEVLKTPC